MLQLCERGSQIGAGRDRDEARVAEPDLGVGDRHSRHTAVGGIDEMFAHTERKAPLKRNIEGDEVGKTAVYLLSDLSSAVTGENIFVDSGFNIVGL